MLRAALVLVLAGLVAGCATDRHLRWSGPLVVDGVDSKHLSADVRIGGEIKGEGEVTRILWFIKIGPTEWAEGVTYGAGGSGGGGFPLFGDSDEDLAKAAAAWQACSTGKNMIILVPRYRIHVDDFLVFKKTHAWVEGTGADITSVSVR